MRVLVIGGTGFTGSALIDYLASMNGLDITAVVHKTPMNRTYDNILYIQSSLQKLPSILSKFEDFDYVFHLARIPGRRWGNAGRVIAGIKGALANRRLLYTLRRYGSKSRLVYLSGSLMYGHTPGKKSLETDVLQPVGFGRYYSLAEQPLLQAINHRQGNIIMLRAPWILGKGSWFTQLYEQYLRKHKALPVYGDTDRRMSVITLEDCARLLWHYAVNAPAAGVYNIYTFGDISYGSFIKSVGKAYQQQAVIYYNESNMHSIMDKTTARSVCCEVLLDTQHPDLLNSYKPIFTDLDTYLTQLAQKHG